MGHINLPARYFRYFPADAPLGHAHQTLALDSGETALLLVDVYHAAEKSARDLVNTAWDGVWWRVVDEHLVPLIRSARAFGLPVIYVTNSSPRIEIGRSAFGARLRESMGFDPEDHFRERDVDPREYEQGEPVQLVFPPQLEPAPGDHYIRKHTYSGFFETRLDSLLRNRGIRTLLCAGFVADCCLLFTMADAVFRGYRAVAMRDCTLAVELPHEVGTLAQTERTIGWIERFLGPSATASDFVRAVEAAGPGP